MTSFREHPVYNRIEAVRKEKGISREELAQALDLRYSELGFIETQKVTPGLALALRISAYLGVPVESLFSLTPYQSEWLV
ncbi:DNA-binding XRE family transcriptional regulator [Thermosporothrix hazakensis]|uniref:DNA-binding XRE family transcriptional regulator n=2 Tax=Thermosporothrix TaxID=768650 RepID=A0A326U2Y5_THEHA|nr:helix-turn-helix domain-containing protein [Thermosporothrix hazakensis]PZW22996.1 DNA-binding XRE family transcriptional regulator [Thermosporothrix hazakensis]BBH90087.1 hypothetical protein KTC_48380 [Thermosporothrix sp. COM3]GCE48308.1 hypothetical protein KTH_31770 [Thermosporothrix hazakensis]